MQLGRQHKNFYQLLGLNHDAGTKDVKRAYRSMAKKYHPDLSDEPQASTKFKEIHDAYEILVDPYKRRVYNSVIDQNSSVKAYYDHLYRQEMKRRQQNRARKRAAYAYYKYRERQEAQATHNTPITFHFKQCLGFLVVGSLFSIGVLAFTLGLYFIFFTGFNGSMISGYFTSAFGGLLSYHTGKSFQVLFKIWHDWFEQEEE